MLRKVVFMVMLICLMDFNSVLIAALVNSWSFDEGAGTTAYDSFGSIADNGTLQNGAGWGSGVYSPSSLSLDGYDDYVSIPHSTEVDLGTGDFSFSFWMQKNTISRKFIYNQKNGADFVAIEMTANGYLLFWVKKGGVFKAQLYTSGPLSANMLYHVAIVADRNDVNNSFIYVNGVDMTRRTDDLMAADDISLPVGADIGRWSGGNGMYNFDGMIDEFKMFNHALSEQEVSQLLYVEMEMLLSEDFEGGVLPEGWRIVDNAGGSANPAFSVSTGHDGTGGDYGLGAHIGDNIDSGPNNTAGGWLQAPVSVIGNTAFTVDADVRIDHEGTLDDARILMGNLDSGPYIDILLAADGQQNNNDVSIVALTRTGNQTMILDNYGSAYSDDTWYKIEIMWQPTNGTMGTLTFKAFDPTDNSLYNEFEITYVNMSELVQFGFGTGNDQATFDNIVIKGTRPSGPFDIADFGAVGDGVTDDGPAIRSAVWHAVCANVDRRVVFDGNKAYYLGDRPNHLFAIELEHIQDLTLEGNGCTLLLHPQMCMMGFWRSENISVSGFEMDYSPIPFSQGTILSKNPGGGTFQIDIDFNLPPPITQSEFEANWGGDWDLSAIWEASRDIEDTWLRPISIVEISPPGRYDITPRSSDLYKIDLLDIGDIFVFRNFQGITNAQRLVRIDATATAADGERKFRERGSLFSIQKCKNVELKEVTIYSTKYDAILCDNSSNLVFEGLRIRTPDRLRKMTTLSTVVTVSNSDIDANDILIERAADDLFVRGDYYSAVTKVYSDTEFEVEFSAPLSYLPTDLKTGQTVVCFKIDPATVQVLDVLDQAVITDCVYISLRKRRITLDHPVPDMAVGSHAVGAKYSAKVTNSTFAMGANNGIYAKNDILVSGCTFTKNNYDISFRDYATSLQYSYDVIISDNMFINTDIRSVILKGHPGVSTNYQYLRNFHWQDYEEKASLVACVNWNGGRIEDNVFDFLSTASHMSPSIEKQNCSNYTDINNVDIFHTGDPAEPDSLIAVNDSGSIHLDWADSPEPDVCSYNVYRGTISGGDYTPVIKGLANSHCNDGDLVYGSTYYYVVTAVDTTGNESDYSNEASAIALPAADLNGDGRVDILDFSKFAEFWGAGDCGSPDWCGGADFDQNTAVDLNDLQEIVRFWVWQ